MSGGAIYEQLGLAPGHSIELLKALHILTKDGRINQDSRRKLKQVQHLLQFMTPIVQELVQTPQNEPSEPLVLVDHGAGKSYLGFMLLDWLRNHGLVHAGSSPATTQAQVKVIGVETRAELVERASTLAHNMGFAHCMKFINMPVAQSTEHPELPTHVHMVTALHACNTATDDAIAFALAKKAKAIVLVPCCQAEVAAYLRSRKASPLGKSSLSALWRKPLHTREFGSHITNVLRTLQLEAHGYQVTVTELVGWEHSMKNELIIAKKHQNSNPHAARQLKQLLVDLGLDGEDGLVLRFGVPVW